MRTYKRELKITANKQPNKHPTQTIMSITLIGLLFWGTISLIIRSSQRQAEGKDQTANFYAQEKEREEKWRQKMNS